MAILFFVVLLVGLRSNARQRYSDGWIRAQEAPVTAELVREVVDSRWHRFVSAMVGLFVGLILAIPVGLALEPTDSLDPTPSSAVWIIPFVCTFVGRGFPGLVFTLRTVTGPVRVATSWAPRLTDYVSSTGLVVMRVELVVVLVAGVAATQSPTLTGVSFEPGQSAYAWGAIVVVALIWAGVELLARRLVAQPQPSGDAATLFWRDALRGEILRDFCVLLAQLGVAAMWVISHSLPRYFGTPAAVSELVVKTAVSVVIIALVFSASTLMTRAPTSHRSEALLVAARRSSHGA